MHTFGHLASRRFARPVRLGIAVALTAAMSVGGLLALPGGASATPPPVTTTTAGTVYDSIPDGNPGNVVSEAFEAQSASEFGGLVQLTSGSTSDPVVTVLMSSWGCSSGHWYDDTCATTPGAGFAEPITLNIYAKSNPVTVEGSAPGPLLMTSTRTFTIPYRPSKDDTHCTGGRWYDSASATCFNGFATPITFHLSGLLAPSAVVISVAYSTTHYGAHPYGQGTPCFTSSGGCGYDSLNVGLDNTGSALTPTVGTDPIPDGVFLNSSWSGAYCGSGNPGVGSFVWDSGCWGGLQPAIRVQGATPTVLTAYPSIAKVLPGLVVTLHLSARLTTDDGNPVVGEPIKFGAAGRFVCSATTNANGVAACTGLLKGVVQSVLALGYNASFGGDGVLLPSNAHGRLIVVG